MRGGADGGAAAGDSDVSSCISEDDISACPVNDSDYKPDSDNSDDDDNLSETGGGGRRYLGSIYQREYGSIPWLSSLPPDAPAPPVPPHQSGFRPLDGGVDQISQDFEDKLGRFGEVSPYSVSTTLPRNNGAGMRPPPPPQLHQQHSHPFAQQHPSDSLPQPYGVIVNHPSLQRNSTSLVMQDSHQPRFEHRPCDVMDGGGGGSLRRPERERPLTSQGHHQGFGQRSSYQNAQGRVPSQRVSVTSLPAAPGKSHGGSTHDLAVYYQNNMNVQKKGIFRRPMTVDEIMSWTGEGLGKPLTQAANKTAKKEACEVFKHIQVYMKDRKTKDKAATITGLAQEIIDTGYTKPALRDEIYVQLCKQTNGNMQEESLRRGWELMAICLTFFPPTPEFEPVLQDYIIQHSVIQDVIFRIPVLGSKEGREVMIQWPLHRYAVKCAKRLSRIGVQGRLAPRKPTKEEIEQSKWQIIWPSQFGNTLAETMEQQQKAVPALATRRLPWVLTTLAQKILDLKGESTEGIFRVPADFDDVNRVKIYLDQWDADKILDCHTAASLFKQWFRELYEPLIPDDLYEEAIRLGQQLDSDLADYDNHKPREMVRDFVQNQLTTELNYHTLLYLINYLQRFTAPDTVAQTKMNEANLATIFAPNILRCPSTDAIVMIQNAAKEKAFVKNLIKWLDTTEIKGVL